ncbi:vacuolar transporter chaperone, putative [Plasmodium reichenowi]|uniref:Vacuolar transporter chaperone, putative n=1 Tax=Plasmodium reichenowi TaxID=5854 RepID=A0A151LPG5_PLARE|nr:vacuolar transporter chaperone, putative [Plasmodium reichenowi]KYO01101.1 vacuolar transporter chaperone, putative [Plasmodium reichenowi]
MDDIPSHYRKYYVSYKKIKRKILKMGKKYKKKLEKDLVQNTVKMVDKQGMKMLPPFLYNDIISKEIVKINKFAEYKYKEVIYNLKNIYYTLKEIERDKRKKINNSNNYNYNNNNNEDNYNNNSVCTEKDYINMDCIEKKLDLIGNDIIHIDFYIHKNCKIIMKLGFFFDKVMNISINQWLRLSLIREKFCNINIDNLIVYLSFLYSLLKENINVQDDKNQIWVPPDTFERTSSKFLIRYKDIVYTKVKIVKHLPYLIFGLTNEDIENNFKELIEQETFADLHMENPSAEKINEVCEKINKKVSIQNIDDKMNDMSYYIPYNNSSDISPQKKENIMKPLKESQQITSIYFDNKDATCYSRRILRYENAQLIRFRWYNDNEGDPNKDIFIERKTHHEEWTGEVSTKERFVLEQKYVLKFMKGDLNISDFFLKKLKKKNYQKKNYQKKNYQKKNYQKKELSKGYNYKKEEMNKISQHECDYNKSSQNKDDNKNINHNNHNNNNNNNNNIIGEKNTSEYRKKIKKNIKLAKEIQMMIIKNKLEPIIRTSYLRSAFQLQNNNSVRISIDTNVSMLNEYVSKRKNWCRLSEEALRKNEIIRLNYGIIEIKLKTDNMPTWVTNILNNNESINAYKYSKYQTAMALLHAEKIKYIPIWIHQNIQSIFHSSNNNIDNNSIQKLSDKYITNNSNHVLSLNNNILNMSNPSSYKINIFSNQLTNQFNISQCNTLQKYNLLQQTSFWLHNKYNKPNKKYKTINLIKIDPKINFAAERTFLHYMLISLYINILTLFLEKYKNKRGNLNLLILLLLFTSFTSLISTYFFFLKRVDIIQRRKTREPIMGRLRFDSFFSPLIFLLLLFFSIILSIYYNFNIK